MALDKLVDSAQLDADLTSVANAIRTKGGTSGSLAFPAGFVSAVEAIETEGGGISFDEIAMRTFSEDVVVSTEGLKPYAFSDSSITSFVGNSVIGNDYVASKTVGSNVFAGCKSLKRIEMREFINSVSNADYLFDGCTALETVILPKFQRGRNYVFRNCSSLTGIVLPSYRYSNTGAFSGCSNLEYADMGQLVTPGSGIPGADFQNCAKLKTLILRYSSMRSLGNISAFTGTPFASDGSGGTLYVPSALISNYQSATNWSTILGYENNSIQAIEGSIYETQYADGTPIT